ncbi:hypothetical protein EDC01DRAFT_743436 [Geopyxis carbonaria]|nr:hypothetical protein EDC01DRAFT_743436 [Geopyxis carbonaria]
MSLAEPPSFDEIVYALNGVFHGLPFLNKGSPCPVIPKPHELNIAPLDRNDSDVYIDDEFGSAPDMAWQAATSRRLEIMDFLSLLLVQDNTSEAATAYIRKKHSLEFFYCKNRQCTFEEKAYIHKIFHIAKQKHIRFAPREYEILHLVMKTCHKKIKSRIALVLKMASELKNNGIHTEDLLSEQQKNTFMEGSELSFQDWMSSWFKELKNARINFDPRAACGDVITAFSIGKIVKMDSMIDQELLDQIRKLGDYLIAVSILVREVQQIDNKLLARLRLQEVVPQPPPKKIQITKSVAEILDNWSRHNQDDGITEEDLCATYPRLRNSISTSTPPFNNTVAVHYECTLVTHIVNQRGCGNKVPLKLEAYPHIDILVSRCCSNNVYGWTLPQGASRLIGEGMNEVIRSHIDEIRHSILEKKIDSAPRDDSMEKRLKDVTISKNF